MACRVSIRRLNELCCVFEQSTTLVGAEPGAVDMLFSYHQMAQDTGEGEFSTSSFSSRCSPAIMASPTQPPSSAPSRAPVHPIQHYYV